MSDPNELLDAYEAEIEALQAENELLDEYESEIAALQAENARLRKALEATNKLIHTARDKVPEDDETILSDIFAHYLNRATALINASLKENKP